MTPAAAEALAVRISQTWPRSAPVDVWVEDIADLDEGAAGTAFARWRREETRPPSIAEFRSKALSLRTTDAGNRPDPCRACSDSGWVEAPDRLEPGPIVDGERSEIRYSQWQPCRCPEGRRRADSAVWRENHPPRATAA